MDIKSMAGHNRSLATALVVLILTAFGFTALFPGIYSRSQMGRGSYFEQDSFIEELCEGGYVLYYRLMQEKAGGELPPVDVFFPETAAQLREEWAENGEESVYQQLSDLTAACDNLMTNWSNTFDYNWGSLEYLVMERGHVIMGTGREELAVLGGETDEKQQGKLAGTYLYYAVVRYDSQGAVTGEVHGAPAESLNVLSGNEMQDHFRVTLQEYLSSALPYKAGTDMRKPRDLTVIFAIPQNVGGYNRYYYGQEAFDRGLLYDAGYGICLFAVYVIALALALIMIWRDRKDPGIVARVPLEIALLVGFTGLGLTDQLTGSLLSVAQGEDVFRVGLAVSSQVSIIPLSSLGYVLNFLRLLLMLAAVYVGVYAVGQVFVMGLGRYLTQRCLIVRILFAIGRFFRRVWRWMVDINLTEPGDKAIIKVLGVNFLLVAVFCALWVFGIIGLVIYALVLFYMLRGYMRKLKRQYASVLKATGEMASGKLDAAIDTDLGVFEPLGEELQKVQDGFRQAVEAEVKSRSMKTELVTNVSHDLKTPLTAIITYVGLLKNEEITPEERLSYVDTLEMKAKRLQRLIEDLFEMSKATTGNITLNRTTVDLVSLVRQVELELRDEIAASGVEFRHRYPDGRLPSFLDGEKTYRVFENLLLNVTKYAMPGTRAYIDMSLQGGMVVTEIKNVSREALDFDVNDLTERFVRGDRSRNTDGSGLGLAIARSFSELQQGRLSVSADGDLFKVTVAFPLAPEDPPAYDPPQEAAQLPGLLEPLQLGD